MTAGPSGADVVVSGQPFDETVRFLCDEVGFRPESTSPADDPRVTVVSGHGLRLRVDRAVAPAPLTIRLNVGEPQGTVTAPNGVRFVCSNDAELVVPELVEEFVLSRAGDDDAWVVGRSGMRYRDLIPGRLGGRFIASNIEVSDGGPIPDRVHHHHVRFQMIFCEHGWVDVVYEDQGEPFRMEAGDCVLQPPHIRHRVLASSPGCRVVEIGCPAEHETLFDHELELPNGVGPANRDWSGQRFVRHVAAETEPELWADGWTARDTGIAAATHGLASAQVIAATASGAATPHKAHGGEFEFVFVLSGEADLAADQRVVAGDAVTMPAEQAWAFTAASADFSFLRVTLPG